jgi:hypothetical protein
MGNVMNDTDKNNDTNIEHIKKIFFWRSAFFGLIILAAGIIIGSASMSILTAHKMTTTSPSGQFDSLMPRLNRILGLTQQQGNKIRPILDGHMQHLQELRENARIDIINTLDQMNKEISPILAQRQKIVWQQELVRIQRELNPDIPRSGGGAMRRRGATTDVNPATGARRRAQQQRIGGPRQVERQLPPTGPNSLVNDTNESKEEQ